MAIKSYKDLLIWKRSVDLTVEIYKLTGNFPKHELFGLTNQMRRASASVPANISEGWIRNGTKSRLHFLNIATASLSELESFLIISEKLQFVTSEQNQPLINEINEIGKMIGAICRKVGENENKAAIS